ncbi:hypothetical protein BDW22DRAFT_1365020 [Trametopsis cervina]|nr:hypothetical protein BDW22DRAFT_1365020 [Trametopsis cervina]
MLWRRVAHTVTRPLPRQFTTSRSLRLPRRHASAYFFPNLDRDVEESERTLKPAAPNLDGLVHRLEGALKQNPDHVRTVFLNYYEDPASLTTSTSTVANHGKTISDALRKLAATKDIDLLRRVVDDMERKWGIPAGTQTHEAILKGLNDVGDGEAILNWLQTIPVSSAPDHVHLRWWNSHLEDCTRRNLSSLFWKSMQALRSAQQSSPNTETYRLAFNHLLAEHRGTPPLPLVQEWVDRMREDGVPLTRAQLDSLTEEFDRRGLAQAVPALERMYLLAPHAEGRDSLCAERLASTSLSEGDPSAHALLGRLRQHAFVPTTQTLDVIAKSLSSAAALEKWERWLEVKASPRAWEIVLGRLLSEGMWRQARETYQTALRWGYRPTAGMIHPVLRTYCSPQLSRPSDADIMAALDLFREYIRLTSDGGYVGRPMPEAQADLPSYNTLLRALTHSRLHSHHDAAVSLMEELRGRGIVLDNMATATYITLLMKLSRNVDQAFKVYQLLHRRPDGQYVLDQQGYVAVLNTYCKLRTDKGPALVVHFTKMLKDMRAAGHDIPAQVYTILLRQLALLTTKMPTEARLEELAQYIRRVHHILTLDPTLTPDTILWNQLMDTYQRAGCFREALTIWETMFASRRLDNATISIAVDACAFSGLVDRGRSIMNRAYHSGFPLNKHNWSTWVECLCRHHRFAEAMKVLCIDLPEKAGIAPDLDIAKMILRFARGSRAEWELRDRMKRQLPQLYAAIEAHNASTSAD